ncbi:MAG: serine/threonine protein phosphatase, partial [Leptospira sp.]|nr:serine/threonine protein phosphatase [Leptospira sp.]
MPNKSRSTFHLGIGFVCLSLFLSGYLAAAAIYSPIAAYHRYFTTFFVLPGIIHIGMYMMKFPEDNHPKASRIISVTGWIIAIFAEIYFIIKTFSVEKKFHFTGHYWDFDAEPVSKTFGIVIVLYTVVGFIIIPVFKMITVKGKDRWVFLQMSLAMLVASVVPLVTNVISRDGGMERETYLLSLVLMFVLGFFIIVLVFIGSTKDKTTFMVKIVGITLVTFLLMMQGVSFFTMRDRENTYDEFRIEYMERAMEGGERNKDIVYILQLKYEDKEFIKKDYSDSLNLDLALVKEDFLNTIIYEDIKSLPADKFRISLKKTLEKTHPYFDGYRDSIKEYIEKNGDKSDEKLRSDIFQFFSTLNRSSFVHTNKISVMEEKNFCKEVTTYLEKNKDLLHFKNSIFGHFKDCKWDGENLAFSELKKDMLKYFRYFKPSETRHY